MFVCIIISCICIYDSFHGNRIEHELSMTTRVSSEWTDDDSPHQPLAGAWYNSNDVVIWSFGSYLNVVH